MRTCSLDTKIFHQLMLVLVNLTSNHVESVARSKHILSTSVGRVSLPSYVELNGLVTIILDAKFI